MTLQRQDTDVFTLRFVAHGRDCEIAARVSPEHSHTTVSLYERGRLIFSDSLPIESTFVDDRLEESLREQALSLKAQIEELSDFLDESENSSDPSLLHTLAQMFSARGLHEDAERLLRSATHLSPGDDHLRYQHGLRLILLGRYPEACEELALAADAKPLYPDYRNAYGLALVWSGQIRDGFKQFDQALELNTYYADAYLCTGIALLFNGIKGIDREQARDFLPRATAAFEKAAMIDRQVAGPEFAHGLRLLAGGSVREAFSALRAAREVYQRLAADSYEDLRTEYISKLRSTDRQAILNRIRSLQAQLAENPDYVDVLYELGVAQLRLGLCEWRTGIERFKEALERNPEMRKAANAHDFAFGAAQEMETKIPGLGREGKTPQS
ncbi:MAG TPA: hypothetical protein VLB27_03170 [candidate division Zixibacteria bacterium]|nr:hypothetical protein [candidate division Zixibacteria bacterium]